MAYKAIDTVENIWTEDALSHRPGWTDEFFMGKVKGQHSSAGISLEAMLQEMDRAGIRQAFLVAAKAGRQGLPGCYHMPPEVVADATSQYPDRFFGLLGIDPYQGMDGVRAPEDAVENMERSAARIYQRDPLLYQWMVSESQHTCR